MDCCMNQLYFSVGPKQLNQFIPVAGFLLFPLALRNYTSYTNFIWALSNYTNYTNFPWPRAIIWGKNDGFKGVRG